MSESEVLIPVSIKLRGLVITKDDKYYPAPILGARVKTLPTGKQYVSYLTVDGHWVDDVMDENGLVFTRYYCPMGSREWAGRRGVQRYE